MAQEAANGALALDAIGDLSVTDKAANHSMWETAERSSFAEAGRISAMFGYRLDQRMNAYIGDVTDFGCPGNIVDHWRVQFTGPEAAAGRRVANGKSGRN